MELVKLTAKEFRDLAKLVYERTGIHLPESKLSLLSNRLRRRLRALGLETFRNYYKLLMDEQKCEEELPHFLSAVTTNETYFFRNETLWSFFRETWIPEAVERSKASRRKTLRIWSAASSSGEEAYTAAICLREGLPNFPAWSVSIVGSDISNRMLERARAAQYNDYALSKTPDATKRKWFKESDGVFEVSADIRALVTFKSHNLRDRFPNAGFDLVFLRNVLMYFDLEMKKTVLLNVTDALAPGGCLIVGDVDPIRNTPELNAMMRLEYCGPNRYRKPAVSRQVATTIAKV